MKNTLLLPICIATVVTLFSSGQAMAHDVVVKSSGYDNAAAFWCDANHMAITLGGPMDAQQQRSLYIDVRHPEQVQPIELKDKQGKNLQFRVQACKDQTFLLSALSKNQTINKTLNQDALYLMLRGQPAQLLLVAKDSPTKTGASNVSLAGKYVVVSMPRNAIGNSYHLDKSCAGFIHPGFKTLCWDVKDDEVLALAQYVITSYLWEDKVSVRVPGAGLKDVPNPQTPLPDETGKPTVKKAVFLRDTGNKILERLDHDQRFALATMTFYAVSPDEKLLYAPCKLKGKSDFDDDYDQVCSYRLDGAAHAWESVFSFATSTHSGKGIQHLSIDPANNIYFSLPGPHEQHGGIWKFEMAQAKFVHLPPGVPGQFDSNPRISPDGETLAFERDSTLFFAYHKEEKK
ncbi:hypothetical protein ACO0LG_02560 [Undibacterium sp. Ji42W]|uniref:hypothetical protein n=1 Tax=Undibacterium sp. Ji42W TaxID=3413039 RepID=UPI003BF16A35